MTSPTLDFRLALLLIFVVAGSNFSIVLRRWLEGRLAKHNRLSCISVRPRNRFTEARQLTIARLAFRTSPSDKGPLEVCLGRGMGLKGNELPPPGVRGDNNPPGVLGPPSLANDPHPGVRGVEGDGELKPDHPARVGRFLIGCGMGGDVMRLVRCRTGLAGRVTPPAAKPGVRGVASAGDTGVGD